MWQDPCNSALPGFTAGDYQLVDFGGGRKLERFGRYLIDRPAPAVRSPRRYPSVWPRAHAVFHSSSRGVGVGGKWQHADAVDPRWSINLQGVKLQLRLTPGGQVGAFPEQQPMWRWMAQWPLHGCRLLNLFAYTGGSTVAAAALGAQVVHVDAARGVVQWAKRNAQSNSVDPAAVRWIVDDALTFAERQLRRGERYDALILDPPTFGRGPRGQQWSIQRCLERLLAALAGLSRNRCRLLLWTCHTPGFSPARMRQLTQAHWPAAAAAEIEAGWLKLQSSDRRSIRAGAFVRWHRSPSGRQNS